MGVVANPQFVGFLLALLLPRVVGFLLALLLPRFVRAVKRSESLIEVEPILAVRPCFFFSRQADPLEFRVKLLNAL